MAIDIREIELTDEQKRRIARMAQESGQSWNEIVEQRLAAVVDAMPVTGMPFSEDRYIEDRERWLAYFREWATQRKSYNPNFDDSRESIY